MAYKLLVLHGSPTDPAGFRDHDARVQLPPIAVLPGLRTSRHSFDLAGMGGSARFSCVFEAGWDDRTAMEAALGSPEGAAAAVVGNCAIGGGQMVHFPLPRAMP